MTNKIKGLTEKEKKAIAEFEASLLKRFPDRIRQLILFGSKARRTSTRNSDVDLLVVLNRENKNISREITALTHHPIAKYMVDISPIMVDGRFFKTWSPLLEHIKRDSIVLWTNKTAEKNM